MKQPSFDVQPLDFKNKSDVKACISLLSDAFVKSERYKESRIAKELRPLEAPYYRQFLWPSWAARLSASRASSPRTGHHRRIFFI